MVDKGGGLHVGTLLSLILLNMPIIQAVLVITMCKSVLEAKYGHLHIRVGMNK
jgi:hypothetical protein